MGARILEDLHADEACLYDSTSGWAFGPVFKYDAYAKAKAFLAWFHDGRVLPAAVQLGVRSLLVGHGGDGKDPREYDQGDLEKLYVEWVKVAIDDEGHLRAEEVTT